ncbi:TPA: hypothetical protein ACWLUJ_006185 [Pseudomonas aeruginosa]|nr:hypothetical protein [Pseudomonas aeruginosa]
MSDKQFKSPVRFFTEALIYTLGLCGSTILAASVQDMHISLWLMLAAFPVLFCFSCFALMLSGYVIVDRASGVTTNGRVE